MTLSDICVLVSGNIHPHVVERIGKSFDMVRIERPDPGLLSADDVRRVRGLATWAPTDAAFIDAFPALEIIAAFGVGYDQIDAAHAAKAGIMVTHTPDVLNDEVADTAIGLLINTVRELPRAEAWLRAGNWTPEKHYPYTRATLRGRSVGIFGMGRIGQAIARRLEPFGLSISYHNRRPLPQSPYRYFDSLRGMAEAVDTLICIAPGGASTARAINAEVLEALGPEGIFINVGRGSSVDEAALAAALADGTISAAGLDVFDREPHVPEALTRLENAYLLPHVASASQHTRRAMADLVVDNLVHWFGGKGPITPVPEARDIRQPRGTARV